MSTPLQLTLGVFASDKGPGDAERAVIMGQAGSYFARRGARLVCLGEAGVLPVPLITSARAAGGEVLIVADMATTLPSALASLPAERLADEKARAQHMAALCQGFVGLPGSLASAASLLRVWTEAGGGNSLKPVILFNRNRAFEIMRGFAADVFSHSIRGHDRIVQFADSIEDCWNRVSRAVGAHTH